MCAYGSYSTSCAAPNNPNKMSISGATNGVAAAQWAFKATDIGENLGFSATCPGTASGAGDASYPYVMVEIDNPTALKATVSIYTSPVTAGGTDLSLQMWVYNKTLPPQDDTALQACDYGIASDCSTLITGNPCGGDQFYWSGISSITIPAGGAVLVYNTTTAGSTSAFKLNVRTDKLQ